MKEFYYQVVIGTMTLTTEFNYGGFRACQKFIADFGEEDKPYKIDLKAREIDTKED